MDKMNNKVVLVVVWWSTKSYVHLRRSTNFLAETIIIMINFLQTPVTLVVLVLVVVMEWIRLFTNSCNLSGSGAGGGDGVDQTFYKLL